MKWGPKNLIFFANLIVISGSIPKDFVLKFQDQDISLNNLYPVSISDIFKFVNIFVRNVSILLATVCQNK